ncbi:uncharacterized protein TERG_12573 [Trichophyton rubrum CBS 118892]|uniref:Uncharacterized protein n=1 Tax=Trichophyton rubrum (strain ATCC MYA-4607 / CBS 118892) TaxID=559305 RepID=A0A080WR03_TRIRC|nr:uncharacterized protein TERG_12573 [Trichophyton rubrum CBS 118892]KFL62770.1 hypothetical protein TERG_12573 [Trichophyton rubrum CBS 118892]
MAVEDQDFKTYLMNIPLPIPVHPQFLLLFISRSTMFLRFEINSYHEYRSMGFYTLITLVDASLFVSPAIASSLWVSVPYSLLEFLSSVPLPVPWIAYCLSEPVQQPQQRLLSGR